MDSFSLFDYFINASLVVKAVMLILAVLSAMSWTFIFQHGKFLRSLKQSIKTFESYFWASTDLTTLYSECQEIEEGHVGLANIFNAGFKEFINVSKNKLSKVSSKSLLDNVQRSMRIAQSKDIDKIEKHLNFLATVGSISPYIGLFGTVWGIMMSFHALRGVEQASIAMVAPGISEALIATALGLFAAIPAVISYNRFSDIAAKVEYQYITFQEEFSNILVRQSIE